MPGLFADEGRCGRKDARSQGDAAELCASELVSTALTRQRRMDSQVCAPHSIHRETSSPYYELLCNHQEHAGLLQQSPTPLPSPNKPELYDAAYFGMYVRSSGAGVKFSLVRTEHRLDDTGAVALPFCRFHCQGPGKAIGYGFPALQRLD
ncbi:hypothetical protein TgHK011_001332 [Trichoderma gracile]|nr:hypothetical protein TgHK011_001332 [Trichoderma gracile]